MGDLGEPASGRLHWSDAGVRPIDRAPVDGLLRRPTPGEIMEADDSAGPAGRARIRAHFEKPAWLRVVDLAMSGTNNRDRPLIRSAQSSMAGLLGAWPTGPPRGPKRGDLVVPNQLFGSEFGDQCLTPAIDLDGTHGEEKGDRRRPPAYGSGGLAYPTSLTRPSSRGSRPATPCRYYTPPHEALRRRVRPRKPHTLLISGHLPREWACLVSDRPGMD